LTPHLYSRPRAAPGAARRFAVNALQGLLFLGVSLLALPAFAAPPNILVIMSDDQGRWASGLYDERISTPNLRYLAEEGVRFDAAIAPTPVCSAARVSFYTGRTPSQHGVHDFLSDADSERDDWLAGEVLISEVLRSQGYRVGLFGKWHADTRGWQPARGFDRWLTYDERDAPWINQYLHSGTVFFSSDGEATSYTGMQAPFLTNATIDFIAEDRERPFAAFVNYTEPHFPFEGLPERLVAPYRDIADRIVPAGDTSSLPPVSATPVSPAEHREMLAQYLAAVAFLDEQGGRLLDALASRGLRDDTLIVYASDHGHLTGQFGLYGKGNATRPQNLYQLSLAIPLVIAGPPAMVRAGQVRQEFVSLLDLFPTFAELAGADDALARYDGPGESLLPLLRGERTALERPLQFAEYGNARTVHDGQWKLVRYYREDDAPPLEFWFDLTHPRGERAAVPAPDGNRQQRLRSALSEYFARFEAPGKSGRRIWQLPRHNAMEAWR
jgi:arylsulfatase A-like enzyme